MTLKRDHLTAMSASRMLTVVLSGHKTAQLWHYADLFIDVVIFLQSKVQISTSTRSNDDLSVIHLICAMFAEPFEAFQDISYVCFFSCKSIQV